MRPQVTLLTVRFIRDITGTWPLLTMYRLTFMQNHLQNENNMKNPTMKRNKFENKVHRDVKGVGENGWAGGGKKERE
jgi:hypothetical protein